MGGAHMFGWHCGPQIETLEWGEHTRPRPHPILMQSPACVHSVQQGTDKSMIVHPHETRSRAIPTTGEPTFKQGAREMWSFLVFLLIGNKRKSEAFRIDFCLLVSWNFHLFVIRRSQPNKGGERRISTFGRLQDSLGLFICSVTHFCQTFYLLS